MVNLKNLWIGEKVRLLKSNDIGTFEGIFEGKAKIRIQDKFDLFTEEEIELYTVTSEMPDITFENELPLVSVKKSLKEKAKTEIDLHIEKLNPDFKASINETVLDYQLRVCEEFIRQAIDNKLYKCTIIHGKGEGKLRDLVHSMLSSYIEVKMKILTNREGATEVWLAYI